MQKNTNSDWRFYIIILLIILSSFIILAPKFSSRIFHYKNQQILNDFIQQTISSNKISAQKFWQMREFYCPGSFIFSKEKNTFLTYRCNWLKSDDSFTNSASLPANLKSTIISQQILIDSNSFSITRDKNQIKIIFILPLEEMKKVNGFFDYASAEDKIYIKNHSFWLNQTVIDYK